MFNGEGMKQADAASSCAELGGTLGWIETAAEEAFIKDEVMRGSHRTVWIGQYPISTLVLL